MMYEDLKAWAERMAVHGHMQAKQVLELLEDRDRLKRGDFTPDEFQWLCHNRHEKPGCTPEEFAAGCTEFQRKLFGRPIHSAVANSGGEPTTTIEEIRKAQEDAELC